MRWLPFARFLLFDAQFFHRPGSTADVRDVNDADHATALYDPLQNVGGPIPANPGAS